MKPTFWRGKRVFVTGHTGFKGGWLSLWLQQAGALVHGFSTLPPTEPNLFTVARLARGLAGHTLGDVRDAAALKQALVAAQPEVVFHLAAQPLVRHSYKEPTETYAVNVLGTVHLLEAVRAARSVRAVVNVTTDKCYENREWHWGYRESEPMGGHDPYSSSKACAELVTAAYRSSFFAGADIGIASARAGNVIGGGDWAPDRLLPDFFRATDAHQAMSVRYPDATRPWQHVLEPLGGYLMLAEALFNDPVRRAGAWNFGPTDDDARSVRRVLDHLTACLPGARWEAVGGEHLREAGYLKLDSSKARNELGWRPAWNLEQALSMTAAWHEAWRGGRDMAQVCVEQIEAYQARAAI